MFSLPIVKHLNILKNRCSSFCSCLVGLTFNTFLLEGSKETLHECIIVTITFSTHADLNAIPLKQSEIALACILASPIRMVHQPSWRASLLQCHHPRFGHQLFVSLLSHGPANHQPREDIDNGGKIEPPFLFPGRPGAKVAWEGRREAESQRISWTEPMMWRKPHKRASLSVRACVPSVVLACA